MDEDLIAVPHPTGGNNCVLICGDSPARMEWVCARLDICSANASVSCTAGARSVWIKQSDMTRYLALRLVS